jgi:hypothetical protein
MTHFKNIITAVMLLVLAVIFSIPDFVVAQGAGLVRISPEESQVAVGSEVVLEVVIEDGVDVNAFDLIVTYNPDLLSLANWAYGDYLSNLADIPVEEEPGMIQIWSTQLATPPVSGDGVLVTLTFEGLANGVSAITLTRAELSDPQGNKMLPTINNGSIEVGNAQANPATATPTPTSTSTMTATIVTNNTPTPASPSASTGYPDRGTPTQAPTRTQRTGVQTTGPGATATSTSQPGEATPEPQETDATRAFTPTTQVGVTEPSSTEPGEVVPPAEDSTPTQADPGQEPSTPPAQDEQGLSLGLWLAMGLGLIVLGGGAFVLLRRQREKNYKEDLL